MLILVVDDDSLVRASILRVLRRMGYATEAAASGEEAIRIVKDADFACAVVDLRMPGIGGHGLIRAIRDVRPLPVIAVSGHGDLSDLVECLRSGVVVDFLEKPFTDSELTGAIERAASRRAVVQGGSAGLSGVADKVTTDGERVVEIHTNAAEFGTPVGGGAPCWEAHGLLQPCRGCPAKSGESAASVIEGATGLLLVESCPGQTLPDSAVVREREIPPDLLEKLFHAQIAAVARKRGLSEREAEVFRYVMEGKSNEETARVMSISARTVKFHLANVFRKLEVESRSELLRRVFSY